MEMTVYHMPSFPSIGAVQTSSRRLALLEVLAEFVNLDDLPEDWARFQEKHPDFSLPIDEVQVFLPSDEKGDAEDLRIEDWGPFGEIKDPKHASVLYLRNMARRVWRGHCNNHELLSLLGVSEEVLGDDFEYRESGNRHLIWQMRQAKFEASWETGDFEYKPTCVFQLAVWNLWKQSWRAKVCGHCRKFFIGERPVEGYCSNRCRDAGRSERNVAYWREHKAEINRKRAAKTQRKRGK
jgi:hypothetical protein